MYLENWNSLCNISIEQSFWIILLKHSFTKLYVLMNSVTTKPNMMQLLYREEQEPFVTKQILEPTTSLQCESIICNYSYEICWIILSIPFIKSNYCTTSINTFQIQMLHSLIKQSLQRKIINSIILFKNLN
jgi:hypothetical protein